MEKKKELRPVLFLADDKKSKTGDPMEDEYEIMIPDGYSEKIPYGKLIRMIPEVEIYKYKPLGVGYGIDFMHALQLGDKHCKDFFIRADGYRYIKDSSHARIIGKATGNYYIAVQFYEAKNKN